jgi:hypothetical protein
MPGAPEKRLTVRRIFRDVVQSYRHRFGRVVIAAAIVFGAAAVIGAAVESGLHEAQGASVVVYVFALAGATMSQVGTTFYAGLLDKVVGEFELGEEPAPVLHVLRHLPYGSLLAADIVITVLATVAGIFFVIPGLIIFTLFGVTGPVINIESRGAFSAMNRSAHLVRPHFWFVLFWVTLPLAIEHAILELTHEVVFSHALIEVFIVEGIVGMIVGSVVGLVEVNIAYALVSEDRRRAAADATA